MKMHKKLIEGAYNISLYLPYGNWDNYILHFHSEYEHDLLKLLFDQTLFYKLGIHRTFFPH